MLQALTLIGAKLSPEMFGSLGKGGIKTWMHATL